jgi:hypothetical protein
MGAGMNDGRQSFIDRAVGVARCIAGFGAVEAWRS